MSRSQLRVIVALLGASLGALFLLPSSAHADDEYPPTIPLHCQVQVPSAVVGDRVVVQVRVTGATNAAITGTVDVTVRASATTARSARAVAPTPWTTTVRYEGSQIRVVGPRLTRGEHIASVRFRPDSTAYSGCTANVRFGNGRAVPTGDPRDDLPNTGGPHQSLLIAGLGLVGLGAGVLRMGAARAPRGSHRG